MHIVAGSMEAFMLIMDGDNVRDDSLCFAGACRKYNWWYRVVCFALIRASDERNLACRSRFLLSGLQCPSIFEALARVSAHQQTYDGRLEAVRPVARPAWGMAVPVSLLLLGGDYGALGGPSDAR